MDYDPNNVSAPRVEASINSAAKHGAVYVDQSAPGVLRLHGVDGPLHFGGRMFAKNSEGEVVEVYSLEELPFGANLAVTDGEGNLISHGTMAPNGMIEVYGTEGTAGEKIGVSMAHLLTEIPMAVADGAAVGANIIGYDDASQALRNYSESVGAKRDASLFEKAPAVMTGRQLGHHEYIDIYLGLVLLLSAAVGYFTLKEKIQKWRDERAEKERTKAYFE